MLIKLQVKDLAFSYDSLVILDNVYIEAAPSKVLSIVGPNGSGKSTLLRCIDGILKPLRGNILLDRREITEMSRMEIAQKLGYVQQTYSRGFPTTVVDTVLIGRRPHMSWHTGEEDEEIVWEILKLLDIEELGMKFFSELSGGQQQKVLIARALAQEADILLLDEPTSNLDIRRQLEVMDIIKDLVKKEEITAIVAIHDLNLASRYSDRIIMMKRGKIVSAGDPVSVLTAENIASVYGVEAAVRTQSEAPYVVPLRPIKIAKRRSHLVTK